MVFCPECRKSYEEGVVLCRDCRCDLVGSLRPEVLGQFAVLRDVPDAVTAAMWQGALESQGLHPELRSNTLPAYGLILRDWTGSSWGTLVVPPDEYEEAVSVLEDFLATAETLAPSEDEDTV